MKASTFQGVTDLLEQAMVLYGDDPVAAATLENYSHRLSEPLRIAVAGMVKAGKSTLLNAIIGEEIAPTDTGECTRIITWYRYGHTPRIVLYPLEGEPLALPIKRTAGRLVFDLGGMPAEEVQRIDVQWPSPSLQKITLIDTPGIASLSEDISALSLDFLTPAETPSEADAIIYLMRHMHASDLRFLESFKDTEAGRSGTVNTMAVLSRADEIGAGRIDSMISASTIAERYRQDENLRRLALGVVPVAGLLAQSARSMRQSDYASMRLLAGMDRSARESIMISADRFLKASVPEGLSAESRTLLLERFGLFGIRLGVALIRGGYDEPTKLAHELARRSGLDPLMDMVARQFLARADALKARTVLVGVEILVRNAPIEGSKQLESGLERLQASAHEFQELRLLGTLRTTGTSLSHALAEDAEHLIGGRGTAVFLRLNLTPEATPEEISAEARQSINRWRTAAESPLTDRSGKEVCRIVIRSCEGILAECADLQLSQLPEPAPASAY